MLSEGRAQALGTRLRALIVALVGLALPIAPVTLTNGLAGHDWALISTQAGVNLWIGNNPQSDGASAIVPGTRADWWGGYQDSIRQAEALAGRPLRPSEVSAAYVQRVRAFWAAQPARALELFVWKLRLLLTDRELGNNQDERFFALHFGPLLRWLPLGYGLLLPLGLLGMLLSARRWRELFPLYALVPVYAATVVLFFVNARFRMPLVLPLAVFAAHALVRGHDAWRARRWRELGLAAAGAGALWLLVHHVPRGVKLDDAQGWWQLGVHYAQHGQPERALEHFDAALARDPGLARLHRDRGLALAQLGREKEAESELRQALARQRDDPSNYAELYAFLAARQRFAEAREVADACVAALPAHGQGHYDLGRALFECYRLERGDAPPLAADLPLLRRARDSFARALSLPGGPQEHFNAGFGLGEVERLLDEPRAALEAWRSALAALAEPDREGWFWNCAERLVRLATQTSGAAAGRAELEALERRLGPRQELAELARQLQLR